MSVILSNESDRVTLSQNANQFNKYVVKLEKRFRLEPNKRVDFHTGVYASCEYLTDECFIKGGIADNDDILFTSERITKEEGKIELVITMFNLTDKTITLPKNCKIARIYSSVSNDGQFSFSDLNAKLIYQDKNLIVRTKNQDYDSYVIEDRPDGKRYVVFELESEPVNE